MIRFQVRSLTLLVMLACIFAAYANQETLPSGADAPEYETVLDEIKQCGVCHGVSGVTLQPTFPILSGQHLFYLYVQLKDFKSGLRKHDVMGPIAAKLEKSQMKLLAKYFSEQNWPTTGFRPDSATVARGETATVAGQCVQCHLGGYEGNSGVPRLSGQHPEYLQKTMRDFKHRIRLNSAAKSSLFESYSEDDIKAMSEYLARK